MKSRVVLVIGSFDVPHFGHFRFLKRCAELGSVIVALGSDPWQRAYKREPVLNYWQRKATLEELPWVDEVVRREKKDCRPLCAQFDPDYLPLGDDWTIGAYLAQNGLTQEYCDKNEIVPVRFMTKDFSTTRIIERMGGR